MSISRTSPTPTPPVENPSSSNGGAGIQKVSTTQEKMETRESNNPVVKPKKRPGLEVLQALWVGGALKEALENKAVGHGYDCAGLVKKAETLGYKEKEMTKEDWMKLIEMHEDDKHKSE